MTALRCAAILALALAGLAGCGVYGPPVRPGERDAELREPAAATELPQPAAEDDRDGE